MSQHQYAAHPVPPLQPQSLQVGVSVHHVLTLQPQPVQVGVSTHHQSAHPAPQYEAHTVQPLSQPQPPSVYVGPHFAAHPVQPLARPQPQTQYAVHHSYPGTQQYMEAGNKPGTLNSLN